MSIFNDAKCLAQEASCFQEVKRVRGIKQHPVNPGWINWAEFLYAAHAYGSTLIAVRKKI